MHTHPFRRQAALAACLFAASSLRAQTATTHAIPATTTNLPPIVVQASRTGRTAEEMPANVRVVTSEEIARSGQRTVADVLEKQAGVPMQTFSDNPTTTAVSLRGFGETSHGRVLILVNGERLNNPDMSTPDLMRIPVDSVKRIEVIRGPQTVLYGDFAEAGVINIITDTSVDAAPATIVSASAGSDDTYSAHISKSGSIDGDVTYFAASDWNKTAGYRDNGNYESYNLDASVTKHWQDAASASVSAFYHESEYGLPGPLNWQRFHADPRQTTTPDNQAEFKTWGADLGGSAKLGEDGRLDANLTASHRESSSRWLGTGFSSYYDGGIDSLAFTPRYTLDTDAAGHENRLTVGTDMRYDTSRVHSYGDFFGPYSTKWLYDRTSLAGYAQDEFFITEKLSLTLGARSERFLNRVTPPNRHADSYDDIEKAFEAALLFRPRDDIKLFARASRYYHAPFIDEVVNGMGTPNTSLRPESGYDFEAGTELTLADEWTAGVTVYQMDSSSEIYFDPTTFANINAPSDTRRRGVEAALRWQRDRVGSFGVIYDYVHATFTEGAYDGNDIPFVAAHRLTLNGEIYLSSEFALLGDLRAVGSQRSISDFSNTAEKLDGYATLDLAARYEPRFLRGLSLLAGVDNVLDREYAYCSAYGVNYYPAPGRTWKISASYRF